MPSPTEITVSQLSRLIGTPDCPTLIDLCLDDDFALDPHLIPSARRFPFTEIETLTDESEYILYCQKGKKISQGAAALLRVKGIRAQTVEGGQIAWRKAGLPMVPASAIPDCKGRRESLWVTRHRPKVDRIACPWLIRRFVDPAARFLFVAPGEVAGVAERFDATPFDVEEVFWSHRDDRCTFDTMLEEFKLDSAPLQHLASIVRGADTKRLDLEPESSGLLAASLGLSRMYRDDTSQLDAGMLLYDCFYRWARDATGETHDWPQSDKGQSS